jgi:hypothetical protein
LAKNSLKISRAKKKHKEIAKEYGIMYDKKKERAKVEKSAYDNNSSVKNKKYFVLKGKENVDNYLKANIRYLGDADSIYYRESKLVKNSLVKDRITDNTPIFYLAENYENYKLDNKKTRKEVELTDEQLHGSWEERKEKAYNQIDQEDLLVSFDYIDLLSRVRNEVYLEEKKRDGAAADTADNEHITSITTTIKEKIFNIFKNRK